MNSTSTPPIVLASQSKSIIQVAKMYAALNLSVIPLKGKRPGLTSWTQYQQSRATEGEIEAWRRQRRTLRHAGVTRPGRESAGEEQICVGEEAGGR